MKNNNGNHDEEIITYLNPDIPSGITLKEWVKKIGKAEATAELKKALHRIERLSKKAVIVGASGTIITAYAKFKN